MITFPNKIAVGSAHSKLILIGEHSVVYGKPAIALPFPTLHVESIVEGISKSMIMFDCRYYVGLLDQVPNNLAGIAACIKETLKYLEQPAKGLKIRIHSSIPIGRGLGSSAASAIAIVKSLYKYFEQNLTKDTLMELVEVAETYAHGNPSGIDMAAASSDHSIWFEKDQEVKHLHIDTPFHLVVVDTGRIGNTREAVGAIRETFKIAPKMISQSIDLLGQLAHQAKAALVEGETKQLGNIMNAAQTELVKLGVSDKGIDQLVDIARKAGALGAKLTGGGRGGCIIALAKDLNHVKQLEEAFLAGEASQTWHFTAGESPS
ncbi:mevalonate kinase [Bacillus niameyensis]|uniref:mevalonate kinase n=1 Tax=Bacillus niameyensis TaxID=1522308 RepID=UPI000782DB53|nr:mevalonate kinase [Bacillus niameyensis]